MKKLLAVLLATVMLLGMLPMAAAAETANPQFKGYTLFLKESIAISFYAEQAALEGFEKVVFYKNDQKVDEITVLPDADANGLVHFKCKKLGPQEMGAAIKAELYINGEVVDTRTKSVLDYCTAKLGETASSAQLKALIVDMLNYGAAAQTYVAEENATEVGTLVNAGLTTEQVNLGAISDPQLTILSGLDTTLTNPEVTWKEAALTLTDGIVMDFAFSVESLEGLTMEVTCGDKAWTVNEFGTKVIDEVTYQTFQFDGLNPAQVRDVVYVVAKRDGVEVSDKKAFSVEHYAATQVKTFVQAAVTSNTVTAQTALVKLVKAMMQYGDAAAMYANAHTYDANGRCTACNVAHYAAGNKNTVIEVENVDLVEDAHLDTIYAAHPGSSFKNTQPAKKENKSTYLGKYAVLMGGVAQYVDSAYASSVAHVSFDVTPSVTGTYYIWFKGYFTSSSAKIYVSVDADDNTDWSYTLKAADAYSTTSDFTATNLKWTKLAVDGFDWTAGQNYTVRFRGYTSALPRLDQIIITSDETFDPTDHTTHTYSNEYKYDENYHWQEATCCQGVTTEKEEHAMENMVCSVCGVNLLDQKVIEAEDANLFQGVDSTNIDKNGKANSAYNAFDNAYASGTKKVYRLNGYYTSIPIATMPEEKQACLEASNPAHMSFTHTAEHNGTYYIWAKVLVSSSPAHYLKYIDGDGTSADSQYVYKSHQVTPYDSTNKWGSDAFNWVLVGEYEWTAGSTYTVRFRGSGIATAFDQFVVTNNADFVPGT